MKAKSIARIASLALLCLAVAGCTILKGEDGKAYLAYCWDTNDAVYDGTSTSFYDENTSIPASIAMGEYYESSEGTFYLEYSTVSIYPKGWYIYYQITKEEGEVFLKDGGDTYFAIALLASGPTVYKSDHPLLNKAGAASEPDPAPMALSPASGRARGPILGRQELVSGGYRLTLEYGKLE